MPKQSNIIDRDAASRLNAFIGMDAPDTFTRCMSVLSDLGYCLSIAEPAGLKIERENLFRIFETITIAMGFESTRLADEQEKNRHQVAAASDMLAALRYLRDCIESGTAPAMSRVNVVIAMAEGSAS